MPIIQEDFVCQDCGHVNAEAGEDIKEAFICDKCFGKCRRRPNSD